MINTQRDACKEMIAVKETLLNEYAVELKSKDDDYVKELKRQAEEIGNLLNRDPLDLVISRMGTQYKTFRSTLREEIAKIEKAFVAERTEILGSNIRELENLLDTRRDNEK